MRPSLTLRVLSRRAVLEGAAAVGALATLPACETDGPVLKADETGAGDTGATLLDSIDPITTNEDFYVTSCCGTPAVDAAVWTLIVVAGGETVAALRYSDLEAMPARDREHTLECIGGGPHYQAISNAVWSGLPLPEIFASLGVTVPTDAVELKITSEDGYTTSLPVADLDKPVWLVWRMNGTPLPPEHGYPARLLVPGRYGMKNPKWIFALEFITQPYLGFWEQLGWSNEATYQPNTLIRSPGLADTVSAGPLRVLGTAFAGSDPVVSVEVSVDGGAHWEAATIDYAPGPDVWTLWHWDWEPTPGEYLVQARCTTASGAVTSVDPEGTGSMDGYDGSMAVTVTVE